jgi:hypothetical protein
VTGGEREARQVVSKRFSPSLTHRETSCGKDA